MSFARSPRQRTRAALALFGCVLAGGCASPDGNAHPGLPKDSRSAAGKGKGTPWTILCMEMLGHEQRPVLEQIALTLTNTPGVRKDRVRVRAENDGYVRLYYGSYVRRIDPRTGQRNTPTDLRADLDLLRALGTPERGYFFRLARVVPEPVPDAGRPEWALRNASGIYTLQVAVFELTDDLWDYKSAAAEYVEFLRSKGYEAYYHHAVGSSMVTVGSFGHEALQMPDTGIPYYSPEVERLQRDELLRYNLVNGAVVRVKRQPTPDMPNPDQVGAPMASRLVYIPRREPGMP